MKSLYITCIVISLITTSAAAQVVDFSKTRIIDLSHAYDSNTIYWPTELTGFELRQEYKGKTKAGFFYYSNTFCSPEHGGTHLDAPMHFSEHGITNSDIPVERLISPGIVLDISSKANNNPDYLLNIADIKEWESKYGRIQDGSIIMLRTGWSNRWPDRKAYLGDDRRGDVTNLHFPSYGPEAAQFLVSERYARILGVDTASVDNGASHEFLVHRILGLANVPGVENLTNLEMLPPVGSIVVVAPMKISKGSGAPARVMALIPK